jgi:integrase
MTKRDLPSYCYRRGRARHVYFCRRGARAIRMVHEPGTPEFAAEYARLLRYDYSQAPRQNIGKLIDHVKTTDWWHNLARNTKKSYARHLDYFKETMGDVDPKTLKRHHVIAMRDANKDRPTDATRKVAVLSVLLERAIDIGWLVHNPAHGVGGLKSQRPKRQPWPQDMIEAFRAEADTRTLLIFELLLGTGQRIGDVLAMQWGHVSAAGISVTQEKTDARMTIPPTRRLAALLAATPRRGLFIVSQHNGRPVSYQLAHRDVMAVRKAIGATAWDMHGLRHTAASEIAALPGMTADHVKAITGHASGAMVRLYAGAASQRARAEEAQRERE